MICFLVVSLYTREQKVIDTLLDKTGTSGSLEATGLGVVDLIDN